VSSKGWVTRRVVHATVLVIMASLHYVAASQVSTAIVVCLLVSLIKFS